MPVDHPFRSVIKAASYRCVSSMVTALLVWCLTGKWELALLAGGAEVAFKIILYYFHERIWELIQFGRKSFVPPVIWFTGLSGSGKTTLGKELVERMRKRGLRVELLDGDEIRNLLPLTGFSKEDRNEHVRRVGILASYLQRNGVTVIASLISPYVESREFCRGVCDNFFEIYLSTSLGACEKRDPKGLYRKARNGEITQFTGLDAPYEIPVAPHLVLDTSVKSINTCVEEILSSITHSYFRRRSWTIFKFWNLRQSSS